MRVATLAERARWWFGGVIRLVDEDHDLAVRVFHIWDGGCVVASANGPCALPFLVRSGFVGG